MDDRSRVLLSLQRALLGEVVPELRGVAVDVGGKHVRIEYYFARVGAPEPDELASTVTTEVAADMPHDWTLEDAVLIKPPPHALPNDRLWAYRRHE